jgi:TP901 family phage tail tape measure protein
MDAVEQSLAGVISGFGLQGQAADNLTAKFAKYEEATGQSADAVHNLKMDTDAWNLTANDAGTIMDQLVASQKKFGTVIGDMQSALQKIAPAMQAMGMSEKDGVDLLNLFASAGIDAGKAALGLQTAVKNLKPGQTLNDLIVQISSIQDPLERAQAAGKVFGTRLGSQMADALKPGITSLDDFATSSSDTTDATDKAAQAIEDSWGSRFTLLMHQAGGTLAEFGQSFGPLLLVASQLGPKMAGSLGSLGGALIPIIAKQLGLTLPTWIVAGTAEGAATGAAVVAGETEAIVAGGPAVAGAAIAGGTPAMEAAGTTLGTVLGVAAAVAIPALIVGGVVLAAAAIEKAGLNPFGTTWATDSVKSILSTFETNLRSADPDIRDAAVKAFAGISDSAQQASILTKLEADGISPDIIAALKEAAPGVKAEAGTMFDGITSNSGAIATDVEAGMELILAPIPKVMAQTAAQTALITAGIPQYIIDTLRARGLDVSAAASDLASYIPAATQKAATDAELIATGIPSAIATGIQANRDLLSNEWDNIVTGLKNIRTPMMEEADIIGALTSKKLADALASGDPVLVAEADKLQSDAMERLNQLVVGGQPLGKAAMAELAAGLKSKNPEIKAAAEAIEALISGNATPAAETASTMGQTAAGNISAGFMSAASQAAATKAAQTIKDLLFSTGGVEKPAAAVGQTAASNLIAGFTSGDSKTAALAAGKALRAWVASEFSTPIPVTFTGTHKTITALAAGTPYVQEAGFYDVGEAGRERVYLPQGAAVESHAQLMAGGSPAGGSAGASPSGPLIGQMIVNGVTHDDVERQIIRAQRRRALGF